MAFDKTELPEWKKDNPDVKPAQAKLDAGWIAGERPPAGMWNWFGNRVGRALVDLYDNAIHKDQKGVANGIAPLGEDNKIPATHLPSTSIYGTTTGGPTAYILTLEDPPASYSEGMEIAVKINVANTGAATIKINSLAVIALKKSNGNDFASGNLKADSIYSFIHNGTSFILQGEGGEYGTAIAGDVLTGKTIGTETGIVNGTIPNNGGAATIMPGTANIVKPAGYYSGAQTVAGDADLVAANIKAGINIFGVAGKTSVVDTADATALAAEILVGDTAYVNGVKVTGTMPNNGGAATITPGTANIIKPAGYYSGAQTILGDADLIAANILSGKDIFGVVGNLVSSKKASGTITTVSGTTTVTGLDFAPSKVIGFIKGAAANDEYYFIITSTADMTGLYVQAYQYIEGMANSVTTQLVTRSGYNTNANGFNFRSPTGGIPAKWWAFE